MKIAFFVENFPKLSETFIVNQVQALRELGHDVTVFAARKPNEEKAQEGYDLENLQKYTTYGHFPESYTHAAKFLLRTIPKLAFRYPTSIPHIVESARYGKQATVRIGNLESFMESEKDFDVYHAHFGLAGMRWSFVSELDPDTPFLTSFYGFDLTSYVHPDNYDAYDGFWDRVDCCTGNSYHMVTRLLLLGCPEDKAVRHKLGINLDRFEKQVTSFDGDEPLRLASVARFTEKKGLKYALRAVHEVVESGEDVEYRIAGDGPLRDEIERLIDELNIEDQVTLLGWQTNQEVSELLADSHVFVLPSVTAPNGDMEGLPVAVSEAQATGVPIIGTYHDGIPEGLQERRTGLLVPERDVEGLARSIEYFLENPAKVEKYGNRARTFAEERFDRDELAEELVELYQELQ